MATIAGTLAKYDAGGTDSASVIAKLSEAQKKFGLSDAEVADGLDAFARWHVNEVGRGFNKTSSDDAIANSAIQNALNFKTDAGWKDWGLSNYSGYQVFNDASHYADSPERIAAHKEDLATQANVNKADRAAGIEQMFRDELYGDGGGFWTGVGRGYGGKGLWTDDAIKRLATMGADAGLTAPQFRDQFDAYSKAHPNDTAWWGPDAWINGMAPTLGLDTAKYFDPAKAQQDSSTTAGIGQAAQAGNGRGSWIGDVAKIGAFFAGGIGFAGALGALGGAGAGLAEASAGALAGGGGGLAADAAISGVAAGAAGAGAAGTALIDAGTGLIAGDAGTAAATGLTTATNTGGAFVGSNGLLSGTGNAIADAALNGAVKGAATSTLTGGDPIKGALSGGIGGGFASVLPDFGSTTLNNAAQGAVSGGVGAAVNGGDILTGAAAGGAAAGVGTLVRDAVPTDIGGNTLTNALAGGAAGAVGTAIAGGDVGTGLIRGAVSGGVSGALTDAGVDPLVAGAGGTLAGGLINGSASPQPSPSTPPAQAVANQVTGALGFSAVLPQFQQLPRRDMQWGTRLNGG